MKTTNRKSIKGRFIQPIVMIILASTSLTACSSIDRLKDIGSPPGQSGVVNPMLTKDYKPVSMPMPAPKNYTRQANSLWSGAQKGFFKDQRADEVGDILTITININDKGELKNETTRTRTASENAAIPTLLGIENDFAQVLPEEVNPANLATANSDSNSKGTGEVAREEKIEMKLAATVTQILPNGNMVIDGTQEVRVNFENRILKLAGVIRPEDISIDNAIPYEKVAEARISYGGKGQITDVQQPRYGQQVYDVLMPF